MSDPYANPQFAPVPATSPSAHKAAQDLRSAADESEKTRSVREKAADLKENASEKLDEFRDFAGAKANAAKAAAGEKVAAVSATANEKAALVHSKANESAHALKVSAEEQWEVARAKGQEVQLEVEDRIREKPLKAVLIATAVGFFIGRSLRS